MVVKYDIPLKIQSSSSNCVQTAVSQFLNYYDLNVGPDDIEKAVPVRVNQEGKPMGTLYADIGTWLKKTYAIETQMHVFDVQIIDRTFAALSQSKLLVQMEKIKEKGIKSALTPYASILIDAYVAYLQAGGTINITKCTNQLLQELLTKGPVLAVINYNYLYDYPRVAYDSEKKEYIPDAINGKVIDHAIVLTGFENNKYFYNDPDNEKGGRHAVDDDVLIGSICAAQLNSGDYLLTITK